MTSFPVSATEIVRSIGVIRLWVGLVHVPRLSDLSAGD